MASHIRRVEGGGFSKQERFYDQHDNSKVTPGPIYTPPSFLTDHVQGPIYKGGHEPTEKQPTLGDPNLPHPSRDRTAWMIGITKNDLAYYSNIAAHMGPAFYAPTDKSTAPLSPRNAFSKNKRFSSLTHRYMSKEHNQANLCTASPGPKYYPSKAHIDMRSATLPAYTFGGKGMTHRSSFLDSMVKDGYMYTARPATNDTSVNVGPANYTPRTDVTDPAAPRQQWTKADRFKDMDARFISAKHARSKKGLNSPGPCYNPTLYDIATPKTRPSHVPGGKWCP